MSAKISAMAHTGNIPNASLLPVVIALSNYNCNKAEFLFAAPAENVAFGHSLGSALGIDSFGNLYGNCPGTTTFTISHSSFAKIAIDMTGNIDVQMGGAAMVRIATNPGGQFNIGSASATVASVLCIGTQSVIVTFAGNNGLSWTGAMPTNMGDAINRIANFLAFVAGATIP